MDANRLRFWMLVEEDHWDFLEHPPHLQYDRQRRSVRLASERILPSLPEAALPGSEAEARSRLEIVPQARDGFGTRAYWDPKTGAVMAAGAVPGAVPIYLPPAGPGPTDLAAGFDGVLYVAVDGQVVMIDRRDRWGPVALRADGFSAWRVAADPAGGVWALDRVQRKIARVHGLPLPDRPYGPYGPNTFRPCEENPDSPRLTVLEHAVWPADEREPVAIACSSEGRVALLSWAEDGQANLRLLREDGTYGSPSRLLGALYPYSLAWTSPDSVVVLLGSVRSEAPVYPLVSGEASAPPDGDLYPLRRHTGGPFIHGLDLPPHFPQIPLVPQLPAGASLAFSDQAMWESAPLHHLSLPSFAREGKTVNRRPIDSGSAQTVWHRLYLEAHIPAHCGIVVYLAATDDPAEPVADQDWHEHRFGEMFTHGNHGADSADRDGEGGRPSGVGAIPRGAWVSTPSEIPFHPGLLGCTPQKNRSGLFTVLIQRSNRRVRALRGRFLRVQVRLFGDGRTTPELAALRAYASRFSYVDQYLPELYRESIFGPAADAVIPSSEPATSTQADFLDRFLLNFEGVLTPLEDRISSAYVLTDSRAAPEEALDWLGGWVGVSFHPGYPPERRRNLLEATAELFRWRGTLCGLKLALEIATGGALASQPHSAGRLAARACGAGVRLAPQVATGGAVSSGQIVVLEDFRLRRTFATILGADLADEDDPLLAGLAVSGNSYVGDTLFLGDELNKEFLAVFGADLPESGAEQDAITALFDSLAHRVTVFVHQDVAPQDLGLIRRVVEMESPAHVLTRVVTASLPFMVGAASLVEVDTYLAAKPQPGPVKVDRSQLGVRDLLLGLPSLDPRLERGQANGVNGQLPSPQRPVAQVGPPQVVEYGSSFQLDGSGSRVAPGERIVRYVWQLLHS